MGELFMKDKEARDDIKAMRRELEESMGVIKNHQRRLDRIEEETFYKIQVPKGEDDWRHIMQSKALQHLIDCLNITYSSDKFNHD